MRIIVVAAIGGGGRDSGGFLQCDALSLHGY